MLSMPLRGRIRSVMPVSFPSGTTLLNMAGPLAWRADICTALSSAWFRLQLTCSLPQRAEVWAIMPAPSWGTEVRAVCAIFCGVTCGWDIAHYGRHLLPSFCICTSLQLLDLTHSSLSFLWVCNNWRLCTDKTAYSQRPNSVRYGHKLKSGSMTQPQETH